MKEASEKDKNNFIKKIANNSNIKKLCTDPMGLLGSFLICLIVFIAICAPFLAPYDPNHIDVINKLSSPTSDHLFGTDHLGRDTLSRLIYGTRQALMVALPSIILALIIGLILGIISGYSTRAVNNTLLVIFDIFKSFPSMIFAITILALLGPSTINLVIVITITSIPDYARLVRSMTLKIKENEYVMAAKAVGTSKMKIMYKHILPNVIGPVFIQASMSVPVVITFVAGLNFLGLGSPPPTPSWGAILKTGYLYARTSPWMVIFGGLFLIMATLGFTLFSETIRDILDPKLGREIAQNQ